MAPEGNTAVCSLNTSRSEIAVNAIDEGRERSRVAAVRRYQILDTPPGRDVRPHHEAGSQRVRRSDRHRQHRR